jgi:hypothetical protein
VRKVARRVSSCQGLGKNAQDVRLAAVSVLRWASVFARHTRFVSGLWQDSETTAGGESV